LAARIKMQILTKAVVFLHFYSTISKALVLIGFFQESETLRLFIEMLNEAIAS